MIKKIVSSHAAYPVLSIVIVLTFLFTTIVSPAYAAESLTIDFNTTHGPILHLASGFINSVTEYAPEDSSITEIGAWMWRNGRPGTSGTDDDYDAFALYPRLTSLGVTHYELLVGDYHKIEPYRSMSWYNKGRALAQKAVDEGKTDMYWDIMNEPDSFFNYTGYYKNWVDGCKGVKSVLPDALTIGPSQMNYNASNIRNFLTYARNNGCKPDYISWHALDADGTEAVTTLNDINSMKLWLASNDYPYLGIIINEYTGSAESNAISPGVAVWYFRTAELTDAQFLHASWYNVGGITTDVNPVLDGLVTLNGGRRPIWHFYKAYAQMTGTVINTGATSNYSGVSAYDSAIPRAVSLIGDKTPSGSTTVNITYNNIPVKLVNGGKVNARVMHYSMTTSVGGPTLVSQQDYTVSNGSITLNNISVAAGGAIEIILTPGEGGSATPTPVTETPTATPTPATETPTVTPTMTPTPFPANLALGKIATANNKLWFGGPATDCNDGNVNSTYWEGSSVPNDWTVDLGASYTVNQVIVKLNPGWPSRTQTFSIQGSSDNVAYDTLVPLTAYTFNASNSGTVTIDFASTALRYVRMNTTNNTGANGAQCAEFEVYGP